MSGEFRGVAVTTAYVPSTSGTPVPIQMPADIIAGDLLIVAGGGYNLNTADAPVGWSSVSSGDIDVKIADGSEAGATINWVSRDTTSLDPFATSPNPRASVFAAFSYRFATPYITGGGLGPDSAFHPFTTRFVPPGGSGDFLSPIDSADYYATPFGGFVNTDRQFRFLQATAEAAESISGPQAVADSITWFGDLIQDRTGVQSQPWSGDPDSYDDPVSASWADQIDLLGPVNNDPGTHVIAAGGAGVAFYLRGFALLFPAIVEEPYWGVLGERL